MSPEITSAQISAFREHGYTIVHHALSDQDTELLQRSCHEAIATVHEEMERKGVSVIGGSRRDLQYTPGNCRHHQPRLRSFLFGHTMRTICQTLIGTQPLLVWEQFSVKQGHTTGTTSAEFASDGNPQSLGHFSWHQDSGYVPIDHPPYLSCWIALDDITTDNGPLAVLPFTELGIRTRVTHTPDQDNGDLVGYFGSLPGVTLTVPRGSIICFSSTLFHRSARNTTSRARRAYLAQYAPSADDASGQPLWRDAEPFPPR